MVIGPGSALAELSSGGALRRPVGSLVRDDEVLLARDLSEKGLLVPLRAQNGP